MKFKVGTRTDIIHRELSPPSISPTNQTFDWTAGTQHTVGAPSPQGTAGTRYSFLFWSGGGSASHSIVVDSLHTSDTATYSTDYLLSIAVAPPQGGGILTSPSSADGFYGSGTRVELTASPAADFEFSGWSGDNTGTDNPDTIVLTAPRSITATFTPATGMKNTYGRLPSTPVLIGSFPNPFNSSTTIRYAVPYHMQVTLQVYDGLGQVSEVLDDAVREAGFYQVRLDGVDLASGTYYCRMSAHRPVADSPGAGANGVLSSGDDYVRTIALLLLR